jgi:hypothetical protein
MLSIDKHGNPRIRAALVEIAWLLPRFQPDYLPLRKWKWALEPNSKAPRAVRKKAVVAVARRYAVDQWRIKTGRIKPEEVGLKRAPQPLVRGRSAVGEIGRRAAALGALPPNPRSLSPERIPAVKDQGRAGEPAQPPAVHSATGRSGRTAALPCPPDGTSRDNPKPA